MTRPAENKTESHNCGIPLPPKIIQFVTALRKESPAPPAARVILGGGGDPKINSGHVPTGTLAWMLQALMTEIEQCFSNFPTPWLLFGTFAAYFGGSLGRLQYLSASQS